MTAAVNHSVDNDSEVAAAAMTTKMTKFCRNVLRHVSPHALTILMEGGGGGGGCWVCMTHRYE